MSSKLALSRHTKSEVVQVLCSLDALHQNQSLRWSSILQLQKGDHENFTDLISLIREMKCQNHPKPSKSHILS